MGRPVLGCVSTGGFSHRCRHCRSYYRAPPLLTAHIKDLAHAICQKLAAGDSADQLVDSMVSAGQIKRVNDGERRRDRARVLPG